MGGAVAFEGAIGSFEVVGVDVERENDAIEDRFRSPGR